MPFESEAQRRFMFAKHPKLAKEFSEATPKNANIPEHVKKSDGGPVDEREFEDPVPGPSERLGVYDGKDGKKHVEHVMTAAGGGYVPMDPNEPGVQDATVSDFLLPMLGVPGAAKAGEAAMPMLKGLGEAGELSIGKAAPKMEEALGDVAPKVEAYIKGIQKGYKGSPDIKIWSVKGDPKEIAKLGFGETPGSIPEGLLRKHGLLPESIDMTNKMAPNGYADGGAVSDEDPDWKDKLAVVLKAMGMGASNIAASPAGQVASAVMNPVSAIASAAKSAAAPIIRAELPPIQQVASNVTGGAIPAPAGPPQPTPSQMAASNPPMPADLEAAMSPRPPQAASAAPAPAPAPSATPPAMDLLSKLTDNDGDKMKALLEHLKDQDKRSQFAQALGIIGDTFGNMGMAKAGMRPGGFETPQMLSNMNNESKKAQIENLTAMLSSDPHSQSSRMAQDTLLQSMGIKAGDPREARIRAMPAQAITQLMPQMTDAVKNSIEREKNMIEARKADAEEANKQMMMQLSAAQAERQTKADENKTAIDTMKEVGPISGLFNPGVRIGALNTLRQNQATPQAHPQDAVAVHWAHTHPHDPRSKAILSANGL